MTKYRTLRAGLLLLAVGAVVASCGGPGPSTDPGNRILHALAADPIFARLPPGAIRTSWQEKPAKWRSSWFGGGGWDGPAVIMTFTSALSVQDVYRFYAQRADQAGWTPYQKLSMGYTRDWTKHTARTISTVGLDPTNFDIHSVSLTSSGTPRSYTLSASGTRLYGPQPTGIP
jgi:hypothetical protein